MEVEVEVGAEVGVAPDAVLSLLAMLAIHLSVWFERSPSSMRGWPDSIARMQFFFLAPSPLRFTLWRYEPRSIFLLLGPHPKKLHHRLFLTL